MNELPKRKASTKRINTRIKKANLDIRLFVEIKEESPCTLLAADEENGLLKKPDISFYYLCMERLLYIIKENYIQ